MLTAIINHDTGSKRNYSSYGENSLLLKFLKDNEFDPVYLYNDLSLSKTKVTISKDLYGLSGVYMIFNNLTGDYYVGSASTNKFYVRYCNHLIYLTGSKVLKNAVRKYGIKNFTFVILELFPDVVNKENNKKLLDMEDFYLKSLLPNYNILTEAGNNFGYKHTELSRIKISNNYSLERRNRIGNLNRGKNLSEEIIDKIREKSLNRDPISYSKEGLINMKKKSKPVILYNLNKTVFGEYSSIAQVATSINCSEKTVSRALQTEKKLLRRRFIVEYPKFV